MPIETHQYVAIALMFVGSAISWGASHFAEHRSRKMHALMAIGMAFMYGGFFYEI